MKYPITPTLRARGAEGLCEAICFCEAEIAKFDRQLADSSIARAHTWIREQRARHIDMLSHFREHLADDYPDEPRLSAAGGAA